MVYFDKILWMYSKYSRRTLNVLYIYPKYTSNTL